MQEVTIFTRTAISLSSTCRSGRSVRQVECREPRCLPLQILRGALYERVHCHAMAKASHLIALQATDILRLRRLFAQYRPGRCESCITIAEYCPRCSCWPHPLTAALVLTSTLTGSAPWRRRAMCAAKSGSTCSERGERGGCHGRIGLLHRGTYLDALPVERKLRTATRSSACTTAALAAAAS